MNWKLAKDYLIGGLFATVLWKWLGFEQAVITTIGVMLGGVIYILKKHIPK